MSTGAEIVISNPWLDLSETAPFALASDVEAIARFNNRAGTNTSIHLELLPEPFLGDPAAPVVLLGLNPGYSPEDLVHHGSPDFVSLSRQNLRHEHNQYPFYLLNPDITAPGRLWWERKLSRLINARGREAVAQKVLCVEYFPYHSRGFAHSKLSLPSQRYSFHLVRNAIKRNAIVVVLRSEKLWRDALPELVNYRQLYRLRNVQNVTITPNNCPDGYDSILAAL